MFHRIQTLGCGFVLFICASWVCAQVPVEEGAEVTTLETAPIRLASFKNGYGVLMLRAVLPNEPSGEYQITPLPMASLGTFWLRWSEPWVLGNIRSVDTQVTQMKPVQSVADVVRANVGKMMSIRTHYAEYVQAKIRAVPSSDVVLIERQGRVQVMPINTIQSVELADDGIQLELAHESQGSALRFDVQRDNSADVTEPGHLEATFLGRGILWSPSYSIDISNPETATLSAKAVLMNDLMDLKNTQVELVTGFPHMAYGHVNFPLARTPVEFFIQQLNQQARGNNHMVMSNVMTQRMRLDDRSQSQLPTMPSMVAEGEQGEDLFFYPIGEVTLAKGERGYYPLFAEQVPYRHLYTLDLPMHADAQRSHYSQQDEPSELVVWHCLELTNTSEMPWTTAPVQATQRGRFLGQDTLYYTSIGNKTEVKITQALDVQSTENEWEVSRERHAATFGSTRYDLVTVEGELSVVNLKDRPVELRITKGFEGELEEASDEPEHQKTLRDMRRVNPFNTLTWRVTLEPGRDHAVRITYRYQIYVR